MRPSDVVNTTARLQYPNMFGKPPTAYYNVALSNVVRSRSPLDYQPRQYWYPYKGTSLKGAEHLRYPTPRTYYAQVRESNHGFATLVQRNSSDNFTTVTKVWNPAVKASLPELGSVLLDNYNTEVNVEFLNKLNERKYMLLEELRNRRETAGTLLNSASRLIRMYRKVRRNPVKALRKVPKAFRSRRSLDTVGDAWMEYRYFWMPVYLTMLQGMKDLHEAYPFSHVTHSSEWFRYEWEDTVGTPSAAAQIFERPPVMRYTASVQFKRGAYIYAKDKELARSFGVSSLPEITAVAWELLPFSFVVDWVFPLSDLLVAYGARSGLRTTCDWQTRKMIVKGTLVEFPLLKPRTVGRVTYTPTVEQVPKLIEWEDYSRTTQSSGNLPIQPFIAREPLNWRRTLDALAIFGTGKEPLAVKGLKALKPK